MTTRDESRTYDVRTLERNLRKGIITKKDYEKYVKGLDDATDKAVESKPDESRDDRDDARYMPAPVLAAPPLSGAALDEEEEDEEDDEEEEVAEADDDEAEV